tara:strand:- start:5245 stop:5652 length:408 start_codon:yes stop_codon:yes gene_type:complete
MRIDLHVWERYLLVSHALLGRYGVGLGESGISVRQLQFIDWQMDLIIFGQDLPCHPEEASYKAGWTQCIVIDFPWLVSEKTDIVALPDLHGNATEKALAAASIASWDFIGGYMLASFYFQGNRDKDSHSCSAPLV